MNDLISRKALCDYALNQKDKSVTPNDIMRFPSTQPEPLTDKEQRIFLAAMRRERKVCTYAHEPCEVPLTKVCDEIVRKVKGALWT